MLDCKIASTLSEHDSVYHLRYKIYCQEKEWLDPISYPGMLEKDVYDTSSVHFMACVDGEVVGAMRLITGCPLPIEKHPSLEKEVPTNQSAEVSRLVFKKSYRRFGNALSLYRAAYRYSKMKNIRRWYIVAEPALIRAMRIIGIVFSPIGKSVEYFGAATLPALIDLDKAQHQFKNINPILHNWFHGNDSKETIFNWQKTNSVKLKAESLPYYLHQNAYSAA